ncbi:hypothetical protein DICPUDRAFT_79643 [Dictyostelium purpureum]|uniref:Uncharacterized protein n=1 Tax=Dictyostelium purpureum TaxID=5786 RepID=F0ZN71_DICPU|nr:uncharacterized protein DICPUDRAFT_79643 [Dictyostelium purpureum]EGC34588.1 hypothetical protein DICPUDRAFT_79643 [Dictyostelium purpureum]|eukprot:XP_003288865.1 hypothetical protein DICPUDRAFT_79643 [Dictyostelium purpureum]
MLPSIICDIKTSIGDNEPIDPNQRNQLEEQIVKIENIITYLTNLRIIYRISTAPVLEDMKQSLEQFGKSIDYFVVFIAFQNQPRLLEASQNQQRNHYILVQPLQKN